VIFGAALQEQGPNRHELLTVRSALAEISLVGDNKNAPDQEPVF